MEGIYEKGNHSQLNKIVVLSEYCVLHSQISRLKQHRQIIKSSTLYEYAFRQQNINLYIPTHLVIRMKISEVVDEVHVYTV